MGFDSFGAPQFGLDDVKIATWNATDDYGSEVDVPSVQLMGTVLEIVSAQLEGDDKITDSASSAIGGEVRVRFGSVSLAALEIILGISSTASGSAQDYLTVSGGDKMPFFGICGRIKGTSGGGDLHVFLPKVKVMDNITLAEAQYGQYIIPEIAVQAIDDDTYGIVNLIEHAAVTDVAVPPTNIT